MSFRCLDINWLIRRNCQTKVIKTTHPSLMKDEKK